MSEETAPLRPGEFGRLMLQTIEASEGRRRRRKRDTTPDAIGLDLRRSLLAGLAAADPDPDDCEGWLLEQALSAEASGPVRALCVEILDEYRFARQDASFTQWLRAGAASADARREGDEQRWRARSRLGMGGEQRERDQ